MACLSFVFFFFFFFHDGFGRCGLDCGDHYMGRTYYASVESGHRNISLQNIKKIADGFEMSISSLFEIVDAIITKANR